MASSAGKEKAVVAFDAQAWIDENLGKDNYESLYKDLSSTKKKKVNTELQKRKEAEDAAKKKDSDEEEEDEEESEEEEESAPATATETASKVTTTVADKKEKKKKDKAVIITDSALRAMWDELELLDVTIIDAEAIRIFEYVGFNPDAILRALMIQKEINKISSIEFQKDLLIMCGLAVVKGSVNANNYKKMSKEGQNEFMRLEKLYGIKRGSGRGEAPEIVTVSRIAAAFPGKIIQMLQNGIVDPRFYNGVMGSSGLPATFRHQAVAAVIPEILGEKTRSFLLGLVCAFSVDQTLTISPKKPEVKDAVTSQWNFVRITNNAQYPKQATRLEIFKRISVHLEYDKLLPIAQKFKKYDDDFIIIDKAQFSSDLNALP